MHVLSSVCPSERDILTQHASTVALDGRALMLCGPSGSGKSTLALELIARGARLVADDRTRLWRSGSVLFAAPPPAIAGQIEARGLGIFALPYMAPVPVALVCDLAVPSAERLPQQQTIEIAEHTLPLLPAPQGPGAAALLLTALRYPRLA